MYMGNGVSRLTGRDNGTAKRGYWDVWTKGRAHAEGPVAVGCLSEKPIAIPYLDSPLAGLGFLMTE